MSRKISRFLLEKQKERQANLEWGQVDISLLMDELEQQIGHRFSQLALSRATGVAANTIQYMEAGIATGVSVPVLVKLIRFFSVALGRPVEMSEIIKMKPDPHVGPFPYVPGQDEAWDIDGNALHIRQKGAKPNIPVKPPKPWATQLPLFDTSFYRNLY